MSERKRRYCDQPGQRDDLFGGFFFFLFSFSLSLSLFLGMDRLCHQLEVSEACNWFCGPFRGVFFLAGSVKRTSHTADVLYDMKI